MLLTEAIRGLGGMRTVSAYRRVGVSLEEPGPNSEEGRAKSIVGYFSIASLPLPHPHHPIDPLAFRLFPLSC